MRETSAGLGIIQILVAFVVFVFLAFILLWAGILFLTGWLVFQLIARLRSAPVPSGTEMSPPVYRQPLAEGRALVAAALAAISAGLLLASVIEWQSVGIAAVAAILSVNSRLRSVPKSILTNVALLISAGIGAAVAVLVGVSVIVNAPDELKAESVPEFGNSTSVAEAWAAVGCLAGSTKADVDPTPEFTYDPAVITEVGSCTVRDDGDGESREVLFFAAESPTELEDWLMSGDLHVESELEPDVRVWRDGAVAFVSLDSGTVLALWNMGFDDLRLE